MKKILIGAVIVLVLILGGALAYLFTQANSIIAELKPEIEKQGSKALNTALTIGDINFTPFPSTSLTINGLKLTDPTEPSKTLSVDEGKIMIGLMPLLSGELKVDSFSLIEPQITVRQTKKGIQIHGLKNSKQKKKKGAKKKDGEESTQEVPANKEASSLPSWLSVNLDSISIVNGTISFEPLVGDPVRIEKLNMKTGVSFAGERLVMAGLHLDAELKEKGKTDLDLSQGSVHLKTLSGSLKEIKAKISLLQQDLTINSRTTGLSFNGQEPSVKISSLSADTSLPEIGEVTLQAKDFAYGADGTATFPEVIASLLKGKAQLSGSYNANNSSGKIESSYDGLQWGGESFAGKATIMAKEGNFILKDSELDAFGTKIIPSGGAKPFLEKIPFFGKLDTKNLDIGRAAKVALQSDDPPLTGTLAFLNTKAEGAVKPDPIAALRAEAKLEIKDGEFTGGNIPALVLQAMKDIPFVDEALFADVPQEYRDELDGDTTPIKSLKTEVNVQSKVIAVRQVDLESSLFSLNAKGTVDFDQNLDLDTTFRFAPAISLALTKKVDELENLLDKQDRLVIPLKLAGSAKDPRVVPNMKEIMKLGAGEAIKKEGAKLLGKMLGEKEGDTPEGEKSESQKITEGVGKLFGF